MFSYRFDYTPLNSGGKAKAFVSIIIDDVLRLDGFKIMESDRGLWVAPPQEKGSKPDANGNDQWFKRVRFVDEKADEKDWQTPMEQEVYTEMISGYEQFAANSSRQSAAQAQTKRPGGRGKTNPLFN